MSQPPAGTRAFGISLIAVVNGVACIFTLLFWGTVFFKKLVPWPGDLSIMSERGNAAITYGFMIGDVLYSIPLLLLGSIGVWRMRMWGWVGAQMANALWLYSMTLVLFRDSYTVLSPGGIVFLPFAVFSIWAMFYLWKKRHSFS